LSISNLNEKLWRESEEVELGAKTKKLVATSLNQFVSYCLVFSMSKWITYFNEPWILFNHIS